MYSRLHVLSPSAERYVNQAAYSGLIMMKDEYHVLWIQILPTQYLEDVLWPDLDSWKTIQVTDPPPLLRTHSD